MENCEFVSNLSFLEMTTRIGHKETYFNQRLNRKYVCLPADQLAVRIGLIGKQKSKAQNTHIVSLSRCFTVVAGFSRSVFC
jgi:hypothetical protein